MILKINHERTKKEKKNIETIRAVAIVRSYLNVCLCVRSSANACQFVSLCKSK